MAAKMAALPEVLRILLRRVSQEGVVQGSAVDRAAGIACSVAADQRERLIDGNIACRVAAQGAN